MLEAIRHFSSQFSADYQAIVKKNLALLPIKKEAGVYVVGMGGSALSGDLINDYLAGEKAITVIRDYELPSSLPQTHVVCFCSYSGNTEEVLMALKKALGKGITSVVFTNGGKLKEEARKNKLPLVEVPTCLQPRYAVGYYFTALVGLLEKLALVGPQEGFLLKLADFIRQRESANEKQGRVLASALKQKVPIVYGPTQLAGTCHFWKIKFNENSKIPSFFNVFPELNHNEMVGWTNPLMKPCFIFLRSKFTHPRINLRMDAMKSVFEGKIPMVEVCLEGESLLQEMFDSLAIADYASYYLAVSYGVDPVAVDMIEDFKKKLE